MNLITPLEIVIICFVIETAILPLQLVMRTCSIFLLLLLSVCGKEAPKETTSISPKNDLNDFLSETFPLYGNISKEVADQNIELLTFELSGGRTLTAIHANSAPPREAFVIWKKDDAGYHRLFHMLSEGSGINDVRECDLNNDGKPDLIVKSCSDLIFPYTNILVDKSYNKIIEYKSLIKNPYINPLILDLNGDKLPEIVTVQGTDFPFGLSEWSFENAKSTFFRNSNELFELQNKMFIKDFNSFCEIDYNTPLLACYPIRIYNIDTKSGFLKDVTSDFPDLLRLHMETVFNSTLKIESKVKGIEGVWKNYVLNYLDSYYRLKTDSSCLEYLIKQQNKTGQ